MNKRQYFGIYTAILQKRIYNARNSMVIYDFAKQQYETNQEMNLL